MKNFIIVISLLCSQLTWAQFHSENFNDAIAQGYTLDTLPGNMLAVAWINPQDSQDYGMLSWKDDGFGGYAISTFDDWLITPALSLTEDLNLNFNVAAGGDQNGDFSNSIFEVLISTTGTIQSDFTTTLTTFQFTSGQFETFSLDLSSYTGTNVHIAFRNLCVSSIGLVWDNISLSNGSDTDASISFNTHSNYITTSSSIIYYTLKHEALDSVYSADIFYQIDNEPIMQTTFNGTPLFNNDTLMNFSVPPLTEGVHNLSVWIDNINSGYDINPINDTAYTQISVSDALISQNILFEEATGTWCGPCQVILPEIEQYSTYSDFIPVALHQGDVYETAEGNFLFGIFGLGGLPSAIFNRAQSVGSDFPQPNDFFKYGDVWDSIYNLMSGNITTPIEIIVEHTYVPGTPKTGLAKGKIITHADIVSDLAFHIYLTEDSLLGGGGSQNAVLRMAPLGVNGDQILLQNITAQDTIEFSYQYTIPDTINIDNLNLVAFVETLGPSITDRTVLQAMQDRDIMVSPIYFGEIYGPDTVFMNANNAYFYDHQIGATYTWSVNPEGSIINTEATAVLINWNQPGLTTLTLEIVLGTNSFLLTKDIYVIGGLDVNEEILNYTVYPNPTSGDFKLELDSELNNAVLSVYALDGKLINSINLTSKSTLVDLDLASGSYIIVVSNGDSIQRSKLIVQ